MCWVVFEVTVGSSNFPRRFHPKVSKGLSGFNDHCCQDGSSDLETCLGVLFPDAQVLKMYWPVLNTISAEPIARTSSIKTQSIPTSSDVS